MKSVLLVDDEVPIAFELKKTLGRFGYEVTVADSFESALNLSAAVRFDAILIEFNIRSECGDHPRTGNGSRLVKQLRTSIVSTPILILTAMEGDLYESDSLHSGADGFICKTTTVTSIVAQLRAHFENYELGEPIHPRQH